MVQFDTAVVKKEKHSKIRNHYLRIEQDRGLKRAIIVIAKMLLTVIYNIIKNKESYNPELYKKSIDILATCEITLE